MIIHNTTICKNGDETIRKNAIFWSFSYFFILFSKKIVPSLKKMDNFGQFLDNFGQFWDNFGQFWTIFGQFFRTKISN
jgi:hypothetical protein